MQRDRAGLQRMQ